MSTAQRSKSLLTFSPSRGGAVHKQTLSLSHDFFYASDNIRRLIQNPLSYLLQVLPADRVHFHSTFLRFGQKLRIFDGSIEAGAQKFSLLNCRSRRRHNGPPEILRRQNHLGDAPA